MESSDSPVSVELEEILSSFFSSFMRMAPERSSANWATRLDSGGEVGGFDGDGFVVVLG